MRHWIGRVDLPSGNITPLNEVASAEEAWDFIHRTNSENDRINKENHALKVAKELIPFKIPEFDKEVHESLSKYLKLKIKLKQQAKESLSPEDRKTYHAPYIPNVIPKNTKLVYMAIHELSDLIGNIS